MMEELTIFYEFLAKGIDIEDIALFKKSYEALLSQEALQVIHQFYGISLLLGHLFYFELQYSK